MCFVYVNPGGTSVLSGFFSAEKREALFEFSVYYLDNAG
jgi:hypothetical protein